MRLTTHRRAAREFSEAVQYYGSQGADLGDRFSAECDVTIQRILELPTRHRRVAQGTHQVHLRRFPYSVVYKPVGDAVVILEFAHDRRRPGYWRSRLSD